MTEEVVTDEGFDHSAATSQTVSTANSMQFDIESKVANVVDSRMADLKKIMAKMYSLQKRTSDSGKVIFLRI